MVKVVVGQPYWHSNDSWMKLSPVPECLGLNGVLPKEMTPRKMSAMLLSSTSLSSFHEDKAQEISCSQDSLFSALRASSQSAGEGAPAPQTTSLLSLLYFILAAFVGSAILLAEMQHHSPQSQKVHAFLTGLMLTSSAWMLWFGWNSAKNKKLKMHQDHQAGASWLKGGLFLFALATLVLDCLTLGYYHELQHCTSVLVTAFPVVQAVFTIIQVSLLSFYAKICIQDKQHLNRFGLMHTLATNILMWMSVVLDESMKQLEEIYDTQKKEILFFPGANSNASSCVCSTNLCHIFHEGADYLHPFNIEFSLFSSTMLYVIWKNTGQTARTAESSGHGKGSFHISGVFAGLIFGALAISTTFGVLISFGVLAKSPETVPQALRTYYIFNSVLLSAMFIASVTGIVTYRFKKGPSCVDHSKSVVRSLDITLLLGSSCGPLMVSIFSLVAIFFMHIDGHYHLLDLCFSLCKTIQVLGQNVFITEALYSGHNKKDQGMAREWVFSISEEPTSERVRTTITSMPDCNSSYSCSSSESNLQAKNLVDLEKDDKNLLARGSLSDISLKEHFCARGGKEKNLSTRKKILQNISVLLIFYNISVWILYAYGTRPHLVSQIEQTFYGFTLWVIIVKISLPLGIFYRMHSVASLFEVYCKTC
ncbi:proton channel OTOP2-like [Rhinatrema bivittatum]|uniref:proton channel OTOP2-like n=1 Tax=Rhinatrema bivittatum TaxID=194408 RepID=UPI00112EA821|nr:proton channel OTOP2-like [Rhinatrema bivittatum]